MVKINFIGHSAFQIESEGTKILIDPFITDNPHTEKTADDFDADYIIVTHGHGDHLGNSIEIAKRCEATIIAPFEVAMYVQGKGATAHPMHIGGGFNFDFGRVNLTKALHGSGISDNDTMISGGNPAGVILEIGGKQIYHAGDTGLFGDMKLIGDRFDLDIALLPIGDNFTMGIDDAVYALKMLKVPKVVPIHYGTFPVIDTDPKEFAEKAKDIAEVIIMNSGDEIEL
ncbi:MAG: metal-dependent hydrolase [Candidatus Zixiibacteriota bacterium]